MCNHGTQASSRQVFEVIQHRPGTNGLLVDRILKRGWPGGMVAEYMYYIGYMDPSNDDSFAFRFRILRVCLHLR